MAKKSVGDKAAYKHKGMKAPRPESGPKLDPSCAPKHKPKHAKKAESKWMKPSDGEQSMAPDHKKKGLPSKEAPSGTSGVNGGSDHKLPKSGGVGHSEV